MQYSGHFTIGKKDNIRFNLFLIQKKLLTVSLLVFIIIAGLVSFLKFMQGIPLQTALMQGLLLGLLGVILQVAINLCSLYFRINSMYKSGKARDFSFDLVADKTGLHSKSDRGNADVPWDRILSIVETNAGFYAFITENNANVIPKDQIENDSGIQTLRALFQKNMPAKKVRLKK